MQNYIISLGGSLIVPDQIDHDFIVKFVTVINNEIKTNKRFFIVTGGGAAARRNIQKLKDSGEISNDALDWAGIEATKDNAKMLVSAFGDMARQEIISDPSVKEVELKSVNVASGWKPGHSTDLVAVKLAETYGADTVINLSNIDYVFDKDPRKHPDAKKFEKMTWGEFRNLFGASWEPGANVPFDPVAAELAAELGLKVVIMNGRDLANLESTLSGKEFRGTIIN